MMSDQIILSSEIEKILVDLRVAIQTQIATSVSAPKLDNSSANLTSTNFEYPSSDTSALPNMDLLSTSDLSPVVAMPPTMDFVMPTMSEQGANQNSSELPDLPLPTAPSAPTEISFSSSQMQPGEETRSFSEAEAFASQEIPDLAAQYTAATLTPTSNVSADSTSNLPGIDMAAFAEQPDLSTLPSIQVPPIVNVGMNSRDTISPKENINSGDNGFVKARGLLSNVLKKGWTSK